MKKVTKLKTPVPSMEEAKDAVRTLIAWAGDDPDREGLIETPDRVARAYQEFGHNYFKLNNHKMSLKSYLRAVRYNPTLHASWLGILGIKNVEQNIIDLATQNVLYLKNLPPELKSVSSFIYEGKYKKVFKK